MTDEWEDSPYAQYVGMGVDEDEHAFAYTPMGDGSEVCEGCTDCVEFCDDPLSYRLSYWLAYWFWLNFYRLKRRLRL